MAILFELLSQYGLFLVFAWVLLEQVGFPIPAYPVLIVAGSLAADGRQSLLGLIAVSVLACLVADSLWYLAGKHMGQRVLDLLCRLSLSADSCVRRTEDIFRRWGAQSLVVAKFIPGFGAVATAMAGSTGIARSSFGMFDLMGSTLWAGSALALGWSFGDAVGDILGWLSDMGRWGLLLVASLVAAYVAAKVWNRHRYARTVRIEGISVAELREMLEASPPMIVDARGDVGSEEGRIPGAIAYSEVNAEPDIAHISRDLTVIVYCDCPHDATAVLVARNLKRKGFRTVRPLRGGLQAWLASTGPALAA